MSEWRFSVYTRIYRAVATILWSFPLSCFDTPVQGHSSISTQTKALPPSVWELAGDVNVFTVHHSAAQHTCEQSGLVPSVPHWHRCAGSPTSSHRETMTCGRAPHQVLDDSAPSASYPNLCVCVSSTPGSPLKSAPRPARVSRGPFGSWRGVGRDQCAEAISARPPPAGPSSVRGCVQVTKLFPNQCPASKSCSSDPPWCVSGCEALV